MFGSYGAGDLDPKASVITNLRMQLFEALEGGHLPPRPHPRRRRARPRHLLHPPLHGQVRDRGHARAELVRAAAGDDHAVRPRVTRVVCHVAQSNEACL